MAVPIPRHISPTATWLQAPLLLDLPLLLLAMALIMRLLALKPPKRALHAATETSAPLVQRNASSAMNRRLEALPAALHRSARYLNHLRNAATAISVTGRPHALLIILPLRLRPCRPRRPPLPFPPSPRCLTNATLLHLILLVSLVGHTEEQRPKWRSVSKQKDEMTASLLVSPLAPTWNAR